MVEIRETQRVPLRCTECARRRVRCDKEVPCRRCIQDHRAHLCVREIVRVRGKPTTAIPGCENSDASLARQNSRLYERVAELELTLMMSIQSRAGSRVDPSGRNSYDQPAVYGTPQIVSLEKVGAILDYWNLGSVKQKELSTSTSGEDIHNLLETLQAIPCRDTSTRVVEFSLKNLGWIHCALQVDEFLAEHEVFQDALEAGALQVLQNREWMSVYFSVLTVGLLFMADEITVDLDLLGTTHASGSLNTCHLWYASVFRQLELSDAMGKPNLHVVQVAAILTLCHSHFGQNYREMNLSALARNTARALDMHRLATESTYEKTLERVSKWSTRSGRELGRRLWWTIVICDWMWSLRNPPSIHPDSFDCTLTVGQDDHNVILGGSSATDGTVSLSPLLHHLELAKIGQLCYEYQQTPKKTLAMLCDSLQKLDELEREFVSGTSHVWAGAGFEMDHGNARLLWLSGQRAHYFCTLNYVRLSLCRIVLHDNFSQLETMAEIRQHGMKAALGIVNMSGVPHEYQLMWVFGSARIAAGVYLCLDLLMTGRQKTAAQMEDQRSSIELCIAILQQSSHKTPICRKGPKILFQLLEFEQSKQGEDVSQDDIIEFIVSMSHTTDAADQQTGFDELQSHIMWQPRISG